MANETMPAKLQQTAENASIRRRRPLEDRIREAEERARAAEQLVRDRRAQLKALKRRADPKPGKQRAHRLILLGATVEKELDLKTPRDVERLIVILADMHGGDDSLLGEIRRRMAAQVPA